MQLHALILTIAIVLAVIQAAPLALNSSDNVIDWDLNKGSSDIESGIADDIASLTTSGEATNLVPEIPTGIEVVEIIEGAITSDENLNETTESQPDTGVIGTVEDAQEPVSSTETSEAETTDGSETQTGAQSTTEIQEPITSEANDAIFPTETDLIPGTNDFSNTDGPAITAETTLSEVQPETETVTKDDTDAQEPLDSTESDEISGSKTEQELVTGITNENQETGASTDVIDPAQNSSESEEVTGGDSDPNAESESNSTDRQFNSVSEIYIPSTSDSTLPGDTHVATGPVTPNPHEDDSQRSTHGLKIVTDDEVDTDDDDDDDDYDHDKKYKSEDDKKHSDDDDDDTEDDD